MYDEHMPFRILQGLGYPNFIEFIQISINKNLTSTYCIFLNALTQILFIIRGVGPVLDR